MEELKYQIYMLTFESFACGVLFTVIVFHYAYPKRTKREKEISVSKFPDQYCFECEIEMPVKENKDGLHCSNCGLYHGKFE